MQTNRRQFVGLLSSGIILAAAGSAQGRETGQSDSIRQAFAFDDNHVPMNAANLCPSPRRVAAAVERYTELIDADCSFQNRDQFAALTEQSRTAVAAQLGVGADEIALVRNTSEANNIINAGLDLGRGDEVVIWEQNHPSNNVAWNVRARRSGLGVVRVRVPAHPSSDDELIEPFRRALTSRTRVLTVTHISNVSGLRLPVAALAELCRQRDIYFHIDGAQTWGALDTDLKAIGCDSFSASAHKWFLGPKEVGMLYVRDAAIERIWPAVIAYGWGDDERSDLAGARKFESLGQRDDAALAAIADAAAIHAQVGVAQVEQHMTTLATRLKEGMVEAGIGLVTPMSPQYSAGVCIARVDPAVRENIWDRLYREYGIIGAPTGGLRLCPHIYNTSEHIDRALAGIKALRSDWG